MSSGAPIVPADLSWRGSIPYSSQFDDVYYSEHYSPDGIEEVRRVFIEPAQISSLMANPIIRVAELGFGTGLNFLVLADQILRESSAQLHFVSFEAYPLSRADWSKLGELRRFALPLAQDLAEAPLPLLSGWHTRIFAEGRIRLSVFHGPAREGIETLKPWSADAWFLDGFAPDRNDNLWQPELLKQVCELTRPGGTVATFTASGRVRRSLSAAGYDMRKVDQRPHKRESLAGQLTMKKSQTPTSLSHAHVIGAGIAGASVARQLAEAGINVAIFDHGEGATSRLRHTVLHPRLLADGSANASYRVNAFHFAAQFLKRFQGFQPTPVLHVEPDDHKQKKFARISAFYQAVDSTDSWVRALDPITASTHANTSITNASLLFDQTAVIDLKTICESLVTHERIEYIKAECGIDPEIPTFVCAGAATKSFDGLDWLEVNALAGRLHEIEFDGKTAAMPIVGNGYLIPTPKGAIIGSTYEYNTWDEEDARAQNLKLNRQYLPDRFNFIGVQRGERAVSSDRNPIVGKIRDNMWVSTGHGSMGTSSAPFAAAILVADALSLAPVVSHEELRLLHPNRFLQRQARRGQLKRDR